MLSSLVSVLFDSTEIAVPCLFNSLFGEDGLADSMLLDKKENTDGILITCKNIEINSSEQSKF